MKIKHLPLVLLACTLLYSCKSDSKKTTPTEVEKPTVEKVVVPVKKVQEAPFVYGIDISSYQGDEVDYINKHKDSIGFVICKATQGAYYTDPDFNKNWAQVQKDGFIRGTYHFYMSKDDPTLQADHFAKTIASIEATDLPPVVDFEAGGIDNSQSVEEVQNGLLTFMEEFEGRLNRKLLIYTDIPTAEKYLNDLRFADYGLWIAVYNGKSKPDLPNIWSTKGWILWQRDADYKLDSFTNDSDVFNGDMTKLKDFIANY